MYCSQRPASFIAWSTSSQRDCSTLLIRPAAAGTPRAWLEAEFTHGVFRCRTMQTHGDDSHRACSFQRPGSDEGYRLAPTGCVSCSSFGVCVSPSSGRSEMEFGRNGAICGPQQRSFLVYVPTRSRVPHFRAIWAQARLSCQCAFVEPNPRSASTNIYGPLAPGTRLY